MEQAIGNWLVKREMLTGDKEAVVDGERRLTYCQLNRRVNRLAGALSGLGLAYGDRLGIVSFNRLEYVEVIMAAAKLGLIVVPLNWRLNASELGFQLADSQTKTLIFDSHLAELARDLAAQTQPDNLIAIGQQDILDALGYEKLLAGHSEQEPRPTGEVNALSPHIIMYTAGTTGKPKGAVLSQRASYYNALNLQLALDFTSRDRNLLALPMFHIGGIGLFTLPMLYVGGTVVIQRTFDPAEALRLLQAEDITLFFGVPAIFLMLAEQPGFAQSALGRLRVVMSGGAPLPPSLVRTYHKAGIALCQGFGMSECAPSIATLAKESALAKAGSIGKPLFHLDARIVDHQGRELPAGQVGELAIRGPNVLSHYWNRPQATAEALVDGWFFSGDLARADEDGDLYIVDRKKDMFISGGENVYPAEVENAIYELDQVAEAAVVGLTDEKWGEAGCAVVVAKTPDRLDAEQIKGFLAERLAKYKIPKRIIFCDQLPRNAAGKVLKNELKRKYS